MKIHGETTSQGIIKVKGLKQLVAQKGQTASISDLQTVNEQVPSLS